MPQYTFGDAENLSGYVEAGDYIVRVIDVDFTVSKGAKTKGSDQIELKLEVENSDTLVRFKEFLTIHESCFWKLDTMVKCLNLLVDGKPPRKDQPVEFTERTLLGLRGWVTLKVDKSDPEWPRNKVAVWRTDREKLPKHIPMDDEDLDFE